MEKFLETLKQETVSAMKAKDSVKLNTLRSISNAITLQEKNNPGKTINHIDVLSGLAKQRKASYDAYVSAGNTELADQEKYELAVIETFLPKSLSKEDIETACQQLITDLSATSIKDMGKIVSKFKETYPGQDMSIVSTYVKSKLS